MDKLIDSLKALVGKFEITSHPLELASLAGEGFQLIAEHFEKSKSDSSNSGLNTVPVPEAPLALLPMAGVATPAMAEAAPLPELIANLVPIAAEVLHLPITPMVTTLVSEIAPMVTTGLTLPEVVADLVPVVETVIGAVEPGLVPVAEMVMRLPGLMGELESILKAVLPQHLMDALSSALTTSKAKTA